MSKTYCTHNHHGRLSLYVRVGPVDYILAFRGDNGWRLSRKLRSMLFFEFEKLTELKGTEIVTEEEAAMILFGCKERV